MAAKGIVIAGTNSGCGKTTTTVAIMAALTKRNIKVQPFKIGPDYIDTMFHTMACGTQGRNIDSWLFHSDIVKYLYHKNSQNAQFAVAEGVMGYYDGIGSTEKGSTAEIAEILGLPVILVVNPKGMARSVSALIKGFVEFEKNTHIKGLIFSRIKTKSQYEILKQSVEENTNISVLGYLKENEALGFESRHLGLVSDMEIQNIEMKLSQLAKGAEETIDIDAILNMGNQMTFSNSKWEIDEKLRNKYDKVTLAVPKDKAFCFYYEDNIDLLRYMGVTIKYFSPLQDLKLPENIHGIYIGGGYPELYAHELEKNQSLRLQIKQMIEHNMPVYGECGGLMYLFETIKNKEKQYQMVGAISGQCVMGNKLRRFGYVEIESLFSNCMAKKGETIKAHEFHYSVETANETDCCFCVYKKRDTGVSVWKSGYCYKNVVASYPHIHFFSNINFITHFLDSCFHYK